MKKNDSTLDIFLIFLWLGFTSFGGPIAQLGYFQYEFVQKRKWVNNHMYSELMALAQILPGPLSTQMGVGLGLLRGGLSGAVASCLGYILPSALFLTLFGLMVSNDWAGIRGPWLQGIKIAVVAIVAHALWAMGKSLCPDRERAALAVLAAVFVSLIPGALGQMSVITGGAILGWMTLSDTLLPFEVPQKVRLSKRMGAISLVLFFALLIGLPLLILVIHSTFLEFFMKFYRTGALVFGGGHVVLPLLQSEIIGEGLVSNDTFLAGYGAAQVIPGPLFTFAAYLGAVSSGSPQGWEGALIALLGIFLPGFLLCIGVMPFWTQVRHYPFIKRMILGVNAAVVGLLLSAFYTPVFTTAIHSLLDFALAVGAFLLLFFWEIPSWVVILLCVMVSQFVVG